LTPARPMPTPSTTDAVSTSSPTRTSTASSSRSTNAPSPSQWHAIAMPTASRTLLRTASNRPAASATTTASGAAVPQRSQRLSVAGGGRAGLSRSGQVAVVGGVSRSGQVAVVGGVSRSGQVAVVGGVSGVVRLPASVLAASDGRSVGLSAAMGPPSQPAVMRCGRSNWMHICIEPWGAPSRVASKWPNKPDPISPKATVRALLMREGVQ